MYGSDFGGAASSLKAVVHGARFVSDWADSGFMPAWHQGAEAVTSHPRVALLRIGVYHHRWRGDDECVAVEVLPWWALRQGVRVLQLHDVYGSRLPLARLVVDVTLRADVLTAAHVRATYSAGERPPRQVSMAHTAGGASSEDWGVIGFRKRRKMVSESAGTVRLTVSRLKGGDAQVRTPFGVQIAATFTPCSVGIPPSESQCTRRKVGSPHLSPHPP